MTFRIPLGILCVCAIAAASASAQSAPPAVLTGQLDDGRESISSTDRTIYSPVRLSSQIADVPPAPGSDYGNLQPGAPVESYFNTPPSYYSTTPLMRNYTNGYITTNQLFASPLYYNEAVPEAETPLRWELFEAVPGIIEWPHKPLVELFSGLLCAKHDDPETELEDCPIGQQEIPERPPLIFEYNEFFLAPGWLAQGIEIPTGAVWRPSVWIFGQYRLGVNYYDGHTGNRLAEIAHRLDLFAQVNLTGTERVLIGLRPLDREVGRTRQFNSYDFRAGDWINGWNADFQTVFFEGDFGEIFPWLDPYDSDQLDYGFSVGRMPLLAQQGLLINEDRIDAVTVTRNTLYGPGLLNLRMTGVYAWDQLNRNNNTPDDDAQLFALLTESDFKFNTVNADMTYVKSSQINGDLYAFGLSSIQRLHGYHNTYNSSVHVLGSFPGNGESAVAGQGELLFSQFSWTPHHSVDLIYVNAFWAIDQFTSPARGTLAGGPLGQTGLLFSAPGLGRFGAPLSNNAFDTAGASIGYQMFFEHTRSQLVFEVGGRADTHSSRGMGDMIAAGMRYQKALGQHWIFLVDGVVEKTESLGVTPGARVEILARF